MGPSLQRQTLVATKKKRNPKVAPNPPKEEGGDDNVAKAQGGGNAPATEPIMPQVLVQCNIIVLCPDHCFTCQNLSLEEIAAA
jgi:hypothetical protein